MNRHFRKLLARAMRELGYTFVTAHTRDGRFIRAHYRMRSNA